MRMGDESGKRRDMQRAARQPLSPARPAQPMREGGGDI